MNLFVQLATVALPTAYLLTTVLHGMAFAGDRAPAFAARWRPWTLGGALVLHGAMFGTRWVVAETFPVNGAWLLVSATALTIAALFAAIASRTQHVAVGGIVLAMVTLLQAAASALGPVRAELLPPAGATKILHVVTVFLAAAALILAGLFGYLHLLLYRQMRRKSFGPLYSELPSLEHLSRLTRRAALAGFLFVTAGLNVGIGIAHQKGVADFRYTDPLVLLTIAIWIHFGMIAFSRRINGFNARRASIAAVAGVVTLLIPILLTLFPGATFHRFG